MPKPLAYYECPRPELVASLDVDNKRILDLGCGAGCLGEALLAKGANEVVGVEILKDVAMLARARLTDAYEADLETLPRLPYPVGYFDLLICADVLEHLVDPYGVLIHFLRFLDLEGQLVCSIPNVRHESVLLPLLVDGTWQYTQSGVLDTTHLRFYTLESIFDLMQSVGLVIVDIESFTSEPSPHLEILAAVVESLKGDVSRFRREALIMQYFVKAQRG